MVLIKRLHSPTSLIDDVEFHKGVNVIKGRYSGSNTEKEDLNGIGKSTLVRLIDFALLSRSASNNYFDPDKYDFLKGHSIVLEIEVGGETYYIKRSMDEPHSPEFGQDLDDLEQYETSKDLKSILEDLFYKQDSLYAGYGESWFRDLTKFFVKDDISSKKRENPTSFINPHKNKFENYKYNLFLLGIPNTGLVEFKDLKDEKNSLQTKKSNLEDRLEEETGKSLDQIKTNIRRLEDRIERLEDSLTDYEFLDNYRDIEERIVELSNNISDHLEELQRLRNKLNEIQRSYNYDVEVDTERVANIYSKISSEFGKLVKKDLDEVVEMRKQLSENREEFLREREEQLKEKIDNEEDEIADLEEERSRLYRILDEEEALDSIENTYSELMDEKKEKERLKTLLQQIRDIEDELLEIQEKMSQAQSKIRDQVRESEDQINSTYSVYSDIVESSIRVSNINDIIFDVQAKASMNSPLSITIDVPKSDAYAKNEFRMLAFDLAVFFRSIEQKRDLPKFMVHDGMFNGMDKNTVIRILNYVERFNHQHSDFQYIVTANEDKLTIPENEQNNYEEYEFDLSSKTILTLSDKPEEMLFGREY